MAPGAYVPDPTEGITRVEDLPTPLHRAAHGTTAGAPARAAAARAHATAWGTAPCMRSAACAATGRADLCVAYSKHRCRPCGPSSVPICPTWPRPAATTPTGSSAWLCAWWPRTACPTGPPPGTSGATTASSSPSPPSRTGSRRRGKKADAQVEPHYLDWALADFSGYLAADELYDGPFCILSAVDARQQRRLLYEVLDHDPTHDDILLFLRAFKTSLAPAAVPSVGITTDGSPLYPAMALVLRGACPIRSASSTSSRN